jgi:membrane-associated protease RseP (regulator of RpoE activity)
MAKRQTADDSGLPKLTPAQITELKALTNDARVEYRRVIEERTPAFANVKVVTLKAPDDYEGIPAGCVIGSFAQEGNAILERIAEAAAKGDVKAIDKVHDKIVTDFIKAHDAASESKETPGLADAPVLAELRYRSKTISQAVFLDKPGAVETRTYPYNGGGLFTADFKVVNFAGNDRAKPLAAVLVRRAPKLTKLESEMLKQVPRSQTEVNIGFELELFGRITKTITKTIKYVVDGAKKTWKWITERTPTAREYAKQVLYTMTMVTEVSVCPLIPGSATGPSPLVRGARSSASAAELLAARRDALLAETTEAIQGLKKP